jgi:DNA-binding NarL/FixJ family response regulator
MSLMNNVRVLVVGDDPLARAGLATLLTNQAGCDIVAQIALDELPNAAELYRPDVIVCDLASDRVTNLRAASVPFVALLTDERDAAEVWASFAPLYAIQSIHHRDTESAEFLIFSVSSAPLW